MAKSKKQYAIIRCTGAGVWAGYVKSKTPTEVVLTDARRLWRWWSQFTLSELAVLGPRSDRLDKNKYAIALPEMTLSGWCEILPCSPEAEKVIRSIPNANK